MPVINRIGAFAADMTEWRHHLHAHPELGLECHQTAAFVAEKLRAFGVDEIHEGIATSGIVALIHGKGPGPVTGLRADMDALPMDEPAEIAHRSTVAGKMHACGHDGHTTMLLGAARYLTETRNFAGTAALIFQPAEEGEGGGRIMVEEGIMDRFDISEVYGLHNMPGTPEGHVHTRPGPLLAAVDEITIDIEGVGGHGAIPHDTRDPIICAVQIVQALQSIVSRNVDPLDRAVVSVTQIHTGTASNIIPGTAHINGTVRTFEPATRDMIEARMGEIVAGTAAAFDMRATLTYDRGYPATVNHPDQTAFAARVAREIAPEVDEDCAPIMPAEDFAYMLEARPGAYLFLGQGDTAQCHHPAYDFTDAIAPVGASLLARLVEARAPVT